MTGIVLAFLLQLSLSAFAGVILVPVEHSCGAWTQSRQSKAPRSAWLETWVLGYLSGMNKIGGDLNAGSDFLRGTDAAALRRSTCTATWPAFWR